MRRLKKKITSLVLLASFTASLSSMTLAADVGTVTDDCVRLRREASTSSDSLGMLVKNGFDVLFSGYWWIAVMPGLYIMLIVFGINLLGDFLRDEFNPKLK